MHLNNSNRNFAYFMDNHKLDTVTEENDLWVVFTNKLKPTRQCQTAYAKANRILGFISRAISYNSPDILLKL